MKFKRKTASLEKLWLHSKRFLCRDRYLEKRVLFMWLEIGCCGLELLHLPHHVVPLLPVLGLHGPSNLLRHPCNSCRWFLVHRRRLCTPFNVIITNSIFSGLYYLAELVEEYTVMTAKVCFNPYMKFSTKFYVQVIRWMVICTLLVYICLFLFENLPTSLIACGIIAQVLWHVCIILSI